MKHLPNAFTTKYQGIFASIRWFWPPPPAVTPVLHSTTIDELVQGLCWHSAQLWPYWLFRTAVGFPSCRVVTDAILLWFFIIHVVAFLVPVAPPALDNCCSTLRNH